MRYAAPLAVVLAILTFSIPAHAQATRPAEARIVILPFTALNPSQNQGWLGRSIQQSILADLTVVAPGRLLSADAEAPDMAAAAEVGRKAGADFVIQGSFINLSTSAGEGLRIMGEVIQSRDGHSVAAFKATGLYSEIFRLEDQVASQIRTRLPGVLSSPVAPLSVPSATQSESEAPPPLPQVNEYYQAYAMPQPNVDPQAYYNYNYANPYYGGYGYGYGPGYGYGLYLGTGYFFGSYYAHGSNFGGFYDRHGNGGNAHLDAGSHSGHGGGFNSGHGGAHGGHH